ncbi:MAG: DsbA family protein [Gemmatimonadetes bacterium]|nr:DsbA family protein [Gemmatimonadota bacterium]
MTTLVMVACAIIATGTVVSARVATLGAPKPGSPFGKRVSDWQRHAAVGQRMGAVAPRVTIVEFADYQCPFCVKLHSTIEQLMERRGDQVQFVYRHLPIPQLHPTARIASVAAECAARQGKFWEYHGALYRNTALAQTANWDSLSALAGIPNAERQRRCIEADSTSDVLVRDSLAAAALDIRGTPVLLINEVRVDGAQPAALLDSIIASKLKQSRR